ncbi:MAG TPA: hypothetical protein VL240_02880, partial [Candidatus Binatia bacterium]|nr:hypothetical protein [Candidatus Binatia bacterium]
MFRASLLLIVAAALSVPHVAAQAQRPSADSHSESPATLPPSRQVNHVFIVMEENHSYSDVIGNPAMPY